MKNHDGRKGGPEQSLNPWSPLWLRQNFLPPWTFQLQESIICFDVSALLWFCYLQLTETWVIHKQPKIRLKSRYNYIVAALNARLKKFGLVCFWRQDEPFELRGCWGGILCFSERAHPDATSRFITAWQWTTCKSWAIVFSSAEWG